MIRGFFDEMLVAERQFDDGGHVPLTPSSAPMPVQYRQLRFVKLDVATAEPTAPERLAALDVVSARSGCPDPCCLSERS